MHTGLLDLLRCPYCGGALELITSHFHRLDAGGVRDGIIGCECCTFPVVDGIPVMHLTEPGPAAAAAIQAGEPDRALLAMIGVSDTARGETFLALAADPSATYKAIIEALGPDIEGGYFLYRFSDPTFVVAEAVVHAVAGTVLGGRGRALDTCGGSGHLTRVLARHADTTVLADLFFAKIWLARRFTAPSCLPVCCDGNRALPFARGVFDLAMCTDALMYIWEKRPFVGELARAVDGSPRGTVLINHTHNQLVWNPSQGDALTPGGYRGLFETMTPRVFGESSLFSDVVAGDTLDLTRVDGDETLDQEAALTLIASPVAEIFALHTIAAPAPTGGDWHINPLYRLTRDGAQVHAELAFPSEDYEYEYGSCRAYLPPSFTLTLEEYDALRAGRVPATLATLVARRAVIEMPKRYL